MPETKLAADSRKGIRYGGRAKGTPNKTTQALKDAIMGAFDASGGQAYLQRVADEDPRTFCTLLGKVLPSEIKADVTGELGVTVIVKRFTNA
jgi:hypothetical protein